MKNKVIICIICAATVIAMTGCSYKKADEHKDEDIQYEVDYHADRHIFESFAEINEEADCMIIGEIIDKHDSISLNYTEEEFMKYFDGTVHDSKQVGLVTMSIRTPYDVRVKTVLSSDVGITEGETISLYQVGGTYCGIRLTDPDSEELEIGAEYVFILKKREKSFGTYYTMITPVQGYAQIKSASDGEANAASSESAGVEFITHEANYLFDDISSVEDLKQAITNTD